MKNPRPRLLMVGVLLLLTGCAGIPADALKLGPDSMADREMQTRAFQTRRESELLAACAGVLQDLGFTIDESETKLGVIVASKDLSAINATEVAAQVLKVAALALFGGADFNYRKRQVIRASLVTRPPAPGGARDATVRVTFQQRVYDNHQRLVLMTQINDPRRYDEFYARLAKSVFLETHSP
ncbi:MAG: hypothetical protein HY736_06310 [Verrucomicrobia bacterium]|nr:hypothetical protein [Verrucomicrobiota bacterium]